MKVLQWGRNSNQSVIEMYLFILFSIKKTIPIWENVVTKLCLTNRQPVKCVSIPNKPYMEKIFVPNFIVYLSQFEPYSAFNRIRTLDRVIRTQVCKMHVSILQTQYSPNHVLMMCLINRDRNYWENINNYMNFRDLEFVLMNMNVY